MTVFSSCGKSSGIETVESTSHVTTSETTTSAPPQWSWQKRSAGEAGIDSSVLNEIHSTFDSFGMLASVIVKDGYIVDEYYKDGYDEKSDFVLNSASKSVTDAIVGIAIDKGLINSVDDPISRYLPEVLELEDSRWAEITVRHLLTHTSGIQSTDSDLWYDWRASDNWVEYIYSLSIVSDPGENFSYSTGNTHLLCVILQNVIDQSVDEFAKENLFSPVGMDSAYIDADPQGISDGGNGVHMNIYDMAKFGLLYLNGGNWQGDQIVPRQWVEDSTSVQVKRNSGTADYGYQWWVRTFGDQGYDAYFAQGHGGQYIFVVPEIELIVVFAGNYEGSTGIYWQIVNDIVNACSD